MVFMDKQILHQIQSRLAVARGEVPAEKVLKNGKVVNVFTNQIEETSVAIHDGVVVGLGEYAGKEVIDLAGRYVIPGLIEAHIHIESSKLIPQNFANLVLTHGTTTVIADPHEIANVLGTDGIRFMIENAKNAPIDILFMLPSCVPATHMETSGAILKAEDLAEFLEDDNVLGIAEMMNFPGAYFGDPNVLDKLYLRRGKVPIDGHAPGVRGKLLNAYLLAGPQTDHECTTVEEAQEKLARGMYVQIRQGSTAQNLRALIPLINNVTERRLMFATDDRRPGDLLSKGHLDYTIRLAVREGVNPFTAIRMATLNPAQAYGLTGRGAVKPGAVADLVVLEDLQEFKVRSVFKDGEHVYEDKTTTRKQCTAKPENRFDIPDLTETSLQVPDQGKPVRVIGIVPNEIVTKKLSFLLPVKDNLLQCDSENDIIKIVVIERYSGKGSMTVGFVNGLGIKNGAIASTVAHDSHNLIVAGDNDRSILTAVERMKKIGGGHVVIENEQVLAEMPLPFAGLMSDQPVEELSSLEDTLLESAREIGCIPEEPFMALGFLALPVIPSLKITDKGLVDVEKFEIVSLFGD